MDTIKTSSSMDYLAYAFSHMEPPSNQKPDEPKTIDEIARDFNQLFSSETKQFGTNMFANKRAAIEYIWTLNSAECIEILLRKIDGFSILHNIIVSSQLDSADLLSFYNLFWTLTHKDKQSCLKMLEFEFPPEYTSPIMDRMRNVLLE